MRRVVRSLLFVGAAAAALSLAGPDALMPFKDVAGAATEVGVAVVVDFGGSTPPIVKCVKVLPSDTGYRALIAAQPVVFDPSGGGLVCDIGNVPNSTGYPCGQSVQGGYQYWSYWYMTDGSGTWSYADRGASAEVGAAKLGQDVEGWRFQNPGTGHKGDPPPRANPDYTNICGSVPTTPPVVGTNSSTTVASSSGNTNVTSTPASPSSGVPVSGGSTDATSSSGEKSGMKSTTTGSPGSKSGGDGGSSHPSTSSSTTPVASRDSHSTAPVPERHARPLNVSTTSVQERQGTSFIPLLVTGAIVAALIVVAALRWRKRPYTQ
jgi:hypothetical protein